MARTISYDRVRIEWVEFKVRADGTTVDLRAAVTVTNANGDERTETITGWDGVSAQQRTGLRTSLGNVLKARLADLLGTNPATHTIVQTGAVFAEEPIT